ncbi:MAG: metallophosphoesterase [Deltaproteobacteria bacterium]|nr:metallophosphoesterase [Deltaproteobacteria bacterium]
MKKYLRTTILLFVLVNLLYCWGCSSSGTDTSTHSMTVKVNIATSDTADNPAVVETVDTIQLEFSSPLNVATVEGHIELFRVKASDDLENVPFRTEISQNRVLLIKADGTKLKEGEAYKLIVRKGVASASGLTLASDFTGFFATCHSFTLDHTPLTGLTESRAVILCISDLHLGDDRSFNKGYGWLNTNRLLLEGFLKKVRLSPNIKELVIAGDLFDEWVAPMDVDPLNGKSQSEFVTSIATSNQDIINALNNIIQDGLIKVTYVPGNHDMLVTPGDIDRIFPGIAQVRDAEGLGRYTPPDRQEIIIEHGHRYDFYNAPDPFSNQTITATPLLPPGFFVSKIAATSDLQRASRLAPRMPITSEKPEGSDFKYWLYLGAWEVILSQKPVVVPRSDKIIKTGIGGYKDLYAINDLVPYNIGRGVLDVNLYKNIEETWPARQTRNLVPSHISTAESVAAGALNIVLDAQALRQYILAPASPKRIVVFGHTHKAILMPFPLNKAAYINTGTWIDSADPTATFAIIVPPQGDMSASYLATYQYLSDGSIKRLDHAVLTCKQ